MSLLRLKTTKKPYREPIYGSDRVVIEEHYYEDDAIEKYNNAESALQTLRDIF